MRNADRQLGKAKGNVLDVKGREGHLSRRLDLRTSSL